MSTSIDVITRPTEEVELEHLQFHPKVRAKLVDALSANNAKLKTCAPETLVKIQTWAEALEWALQVPEQVLDEERKKKAKEG